MSVVYDHLTSDYEIQPDVIEDLRAIPQPETNTPDKTKHRHVNIILDDGSELWLDISTDHADHNFIDLRWFNPDGQMKGVGAFTIVKGRRQQFGQACIENSTDPITSNDRWTTYREDPLLDSLDRPVTGHRWNGGYCVTLLVDKNGDEAAAIVPSDGNG